MERRLKLFLNRFESIPAGLRDTASEPASIVSEIDVDLAGLYHHYYLDSYGRIPPTPDPAQFEYLPFLSTTPEFRLAGDGIGDSTVMRRHASTSLGQAFCRWFLHKYCDITYFSHMNHVLGKLPGKRFDGLNVVRTQAGDVPDYLCAREVRDVVLAEAKGRYTSISFRSKEFGTWRKQFDRIEVRDPSGRPRKLKGYIVGTRFATEASPPSVASTLFAEDPDSPGETPPDEEQMRALGASVVACHYGNIATKLNQAPLAAALLSGTQLPDQIGVLVTILEFQDFDLRGQRFVGGYFPSDTRTLPWSVLDGNVVRNEVDPFRLDVARGTFFGVEESIFRQIVRVARQGRALAGEVRPYEQTRAFYSAVSALRDGSLVAPLEFLIPVASDRL